MHVFLHDCLTTCTLLHVTPFLSVYTLVLLYLLINLIIFCFHQNPYDFYVMRSSKGSSGDLTTLRLGFIVMKKG